MCGRYFRLVAAVALAAAVGVAACAPPAGPIAIGGDDRSNSTPWVAARGTFVVVSWGASSGSKTDVFAATSRDAGRTFAAPVQVNTVPGEARLGGELPPRVALAPADGRSDPDVVVLWTARQAAPTMESSVTEIRTARSRDGGRTFGEPVTLQSSGAPGDRGWPSLSIDSQGLTHAIWLDHRGMAAGPGPAAHASHGGHRASDGAAKELGSSVYHASAAPGPAAERELAQGVCYCCKTALAAGPDGALYAAWRHVYAGDLRDIAFSVSRDGARSFSEPVRVSEDGWEINGCPDDGPAIALDGAGTVHMVWPTVVGGEKPEGALFYASTPDGRAFTPRTRIPTLGGPKPSHPQILVDGAGRIVVAWDEITKGRRVAALREVRPHADQPIGFGDVVLLNTEGAAAYPVLAAAAQGLIAVWTTGGDPSRVMLRTIRLP